MTEGPDNARMRASDADREAVARRLRLAVEEGRLGIAEYDERLREAYSAVTRGDLEPLTADPPAPESEMTPEQVRRNERARRKRIKEWRDWAGTSLLLIGIWLVTTLAAGELIFFWPVFPVGIWGGFLLLELVFGGGGGPGEDGDEGRGER